MCMHVYVCIDVCMYVCMLVCVRQRFFPDSAYLHMFAHILHFFEGKTHQNNRLRMNILDLQIFFGPQKTKIFEKFKRYLEGTSND